ncbi:MAG: hypothetical protein JST00_25270 [Deltaproteobacteria bacterium]|nr:hypothetical protein [Deltaproteobacteria bacterium]
MPNPAAASRLRLETLGLTPRALGAHDLPLGALVWLSFGPVAGELARSAALAKELRIAETGEVPRLRVKNPTKVDVLLPSDLVVDGGKQARVVERSVIVPAAAEIDIPVRCVEAGRWAPKPGASPTSFSFKASASTHSREHLMALKQAMLRTHDAYELGQADVWKHVAAELTRTGTASGTTSYGAFLETRAEQLERARGMKIAVPPAANALAVVRNESSSIWIEAFPSHDHVVESSIEHAADLLPGAVATSRPGPAPFADPRARVEHALARLAKASLVGVAPPPGTKGESYALDAEGVLGFVLLSSSKLAHLTSTVA